MDQQPGVQKNSKGNKQPGVPHEDRQTIWNAQRNKRQPMIWSATSKRTNNLKSHQRRNQKSGEPVADRSAARLLLLIQPVEEREQTCPRDCEKTKISKVSTNFGVSFVILIYMKPNR